MDKNTQLFQINSSHKSFVDRQNTLFAELDKVYKHVPTPPQDSSLIDDAPRVDEKNSRSQVKHLRGKESIFKRPEAPISRCLPLRRTPDFKLNPHKWTKYSLDDVRDEDMSERSNTAAALSFLKELEERNQAIRDSDCAAETTKIVFKKTSMIKDVADEGERKLAFRSSKVLMPEYVVGQKIKKEKKNREKRSGNVTKQLVLNHLVEEDTDT